MTISHKFIPIRTRRRTLQGVAFSPDTLGSGIAQTGCQPWPVAFRRRAVLPETEPRSIPDC
jgi:hypothetical protein